MTRLCMLTLWLVTAAGLSAGATPATRPATRPAATEPASAAAVVGAALVRYPAVSPASAPATQPSAEQYAFSLTINSTTEYSGRIHRTPDGRLTFDLGIAVMNPSDLSHKKMIGRWVGDVPGAQGGVVDVPASGPAALQIVVDAPDRDGKPVRFAQAFAGKVSSRAIGPVTYGRLVEGRPVLWTVDGVTRLRLTNIVLGMGPAPLYARTPAEGRIDVAPRLIVLDDVAFDYLIDAKPTHDSVRGTIRRQDDADYAQTGRGHYDVDLRFNELPVKVTKGSTGQAAGFFDSPGTDVPGLRGTIDFADRFAGEKVEQRKLTFNLSAMRIGKPQVMALFKLAMVALGPVRSTAE